MALSLKKKKRRPDPRTSQDIRAERLRYREAASAPMDLPFLLLTLLLTAMGLVMVLSASFPSAYYEEEGNGAYFFIRQCIFAALGLVVMFILSRMNYQSLRNTGKGLMIFALMLLVLVIIPGNPIAITENGATRWLGIKGTILRGQPSEVAKIAVVVFFSATISKKREKMQTWKHGIWPYVAVLLIISGLMMLEPHLSGTILIVCTGLVLMIVGGIKGWLIPVGIGGVGLVGTLYVILVQKGILHYGENRINTWRNPFDAKWYRGDGWQIAQCQIAIGSGGLLGVGLGKGRQKFLYLPEEHNDCIFAVICEELGLVGACVVMLVFALLILRGFWIALHARDRFGALLVVGLMTLTGLQTFLNIAVVTGLVPATGISLPFFSYGGTALLCQLAEMGIVLSVSRQMPAPENG